MYTSNLKIKEGFTANATTLLGGNYTMRIEEEFDGPMEIFTVAYNGCISMCAKGYFVRAYGLKDLAVETELKVDYDNKNIVANVYVDRAEEEELSSKDREGVRENIKLRCKVSHLLSDELDIQYNILTMKK